MSDTDKLIKLIHKTFNMYGLSITRKLSIIISKHLLNNPQTKAEEWLSKIVEQILSQNLNTPHITLDHIKIAFQETVKPESHLQNTETVFNVINAFKVPQIVYDLNKKKYVMKEKCQELFPDAKFKSQVFKNRLDLLWFRTLKHAIFAPSKFGKVDENKLELVPIEYLLSESKTNNVCVMGLLAQLTEGQYYLEDYGGAVKVDLKNAFYSSSLIMEGSIVLAQGRYIDGVLEVENIDFPPTESSELGRLNFAEANTFGGPHPTSLRLSEKLKTYIDSNSGNYLIFISEFWVDSENVLNKFKTLLSGFSDYPPVACVLFGHFLSSPVDVESTKKLKEGFKKLASIIAEFSLIQEHTNFVFVPGPYDLSAPKILPRPSIPKCIIENFMKVVPGTHLATNPCRIQYCTREIVAFRENMMSKLCRNTLKYPSKPNEENGEIGEKVYEAFAKSIIRQSHLAPLLFSVSPVYWNHDQALQLYPIPDLVVVADDFQAYSTQYSGCQVINPGPFVKGNFSFKIYIPGEENKVEECNIPEDDS